MGNLQRNQILPEGRAALFPTGQPLSVLREAMERQQILAGTATRCDRNRDLWVRLGGYEGVIPRSEAVHPAISGAQRDISVLTRVGRPTCCTITDVAVDGGGKPRLILSRRKAQEQALDWLLENAAPGAVLPAQVTHLADFGAFVDLGCGVVSLLPTDRISVSRLRRPSDRLRVGDDLRVLVTAVDRDRCRFCLSHRELLGTWLENAAAFAPGETVTGVVRSIRDYGAFVELTANLCGLAELREDIAVGDAVSVYIKSIRPEGHKIKLQIVENLGPAGDPPPMRYFITGGTVEDWTY